MLCCSSPLLFCCVSIAFLRFGLCFGHLAVAVMLFRAVFHLMSWASLWAYVCSPSASIRLTFPFSAHKQSTTSPCTLIVPLPFRSDPMILRRKQQEFVLAAKTIGSSATTILFDHLIPNALGSILVTITMLIPSAIFMEAFLRYLGIGLQPPLASLGTMCNDASANLRTSPHELLIPALMICVIMFAFNFVGDGLRDALDPKLKK